MAVVSSTRTRSQKPREHYEARRQKLREKPIKRRHAKETQINMHNVKVKWERYCEHLGEIPLEHLKNSKKEDIMMFLEWMLDTYKGIKKQVSVHSYKRRLLQIYHKSVGEDFNDGNKDILDYINGYLTIQYNLDTSEKEKPVMNVDDVYLVQHHLYVHDTSIFPDERQRIQLALLMLLQAYTATRPRVLVYKHIDKEKMRNHYFGWEDDITEAEVGEWDPDVDDFKTISYKDINLFLLKGEDGGRDLPAMEVTLRYTKGWERREKPKIVPLYHVDDLIFDAILLMIALALLDDAFEANIHSVQDFYNVRVMPTRNSTEFHWRKDIRDIPVFRQAVQMDDGTTRTSPTEALHYHTYLYYLQRLGLAAGLMQLLSPYVIRRGAGEGVEAVGTQPQLQQVMGHRDAGVYQAYMNQRYQVDTIAAFLGRPSAKALMKAASHMSRFVDSRAPTTASPGELAKLKDSSNLAQLVELRDNLRADVQHQSGTVEKARLTGTKLYEMYYNADCQVRAARSRINKLAKVNTRKEFFETINTADINAQLSDPSWMAQLNDASRQAEPSYCLEERKMVADLICADTNGLDDETRLRHRIFTTQAMVELGRRKEFRPVKTSRMEPASIKHPTIAFPEKCTTLQCFFCFWDERVATAARLREFSTKYKARGHVFSHHLNRVAGGLIPCPEANCKKAAIQLDGVAALQGHVTREHGYDIFGRYKVGFGLKSESRIKVSRCSLPPVLGL